MKIRNGFVSNSSSSSFVVLFPKKISNYDELFKMMWTEENMKRIQKQWNFNSKQGYANISVSFEEFQIWATNTILNDIKTQKENDYLRAIYLISHSVCLCSFNNKSNACGSYPCKLMFFPDGNTYLCHEFL